MKYLIRIAFSTLLVISIGCKMILLNREGIKQPALENHFSLSTFLISNGIDTSEILCLRDTNALNNFYKSDIGAPDARFFNRNKLMVDYRTPSSNCNGQISPLIEHADIVNQLAPVQDKILADFLKDIIIGKTGQDFVLSNQQYDVYLVAYWAKYLGKLNKHKILEWQNLVKKANADKQKIRLILVNVDYQSIWKIKPSDVPRFKY